MRDNFVLYYLWKQLNNLSRYLTLKIHIYMAINYFNLYLFYLKYEKIFSSLSKNEKNFMFKNKVVRSHVLMRPNL